MVCQNHKRQPSTLRRNQCSRFTTREVRLLLQRCPQPYRRRQVQRRLQLKLHFLQQQCFLQHRLYQISMQPRGFPFTKRILCTHFVSKAFVSLIQRLHLTMKMAKVNTMILMVIQIVIWLCRCHRMHQGIRMTVKDLLSNRCQCKAETILQQTEEHRKRRTCQDFNHCSREKEGGHR